MIWQEIESQILLFGSEILHKYNISWIAEMVIKYSVTETYFKVVT